MAARGRGGNDVMQAGHHGTSVDAKRLYQEHLHWSHDKSHVLELATP